jgi:hypothetical protein
VSELFKVRVANGPLFFFELIVRREKEEFSLVNDVHAPPSLPTKATNESKERNKEIALRVSRIEPNENRNNRAVARPSNDSRERNYPLPFCV